MNFDEFVNWEKSSRDSIDVKKIYIDMAGDLVAGIILSQIVYWYLPNRKGESKLSITKDGHEWIAKARHEWWEECRVTPKQLDLAFKKLALRGLIEVKLYKFNGAPTKHTRILKENFINLWQSLIFTKGQNPNGVSISTKGKNPGFGRKVKIQDIDQRVKSITETTEKTTTEKKEKKISSSQEVAADIPPTADVPIAEGEKSVSSAADGEGTVLSLAEMEANKAEISAAIAELINKKCTSKREYPKYVRKTTQQA